MIDFKLFGGFDNGQTDKRMDICTSRDAFATEKQQNIWKFPYVSISLNVA